ncbi:hypothetical protein L5515_007141 [Caenorhabditis briggsae]|uniref:Uncharacterized protein n=1 Tax=Caenorhabditis briggsae TaxID=6238 RepID=A0AAE9F3C3_CAEBR|nr:hypothetical protein L5515_007141 [Caenorhabditis briggsae]
MAGELSEELEKDRDQVMGELEQISIQSPELQISEAIVLMKSITFPSTAQKNVMSDFEGVLKCWEKCEEQLKIVKNELADVKRERDELRKSVREKDNQMLNLTATHGKALANLYDRIGKQKKENQEEIYKLQNNHEQEMLNRIEETIIEARKESEKKYIEERELLVSQIKESQKRHDEEVATMKLAHEQNVKQLREENLQKFNEREQDHTNQLVLIKAENTAKLESLTEQLETRNQLNKETIEKLEKENLRIKLQQMENFNEYLEKLTKLESDNQKMILEVRKQQEDLLNKTFEEKKQHEELMAQELCKTAKQNQDELVLRIRQNANRELLKEFRNVLKPIQQTKEILMKITILCSVENAGMKDTSILEMNLHEVSQSKSSSMHKMELFEMYVLNQQYADEEVIQICQNYLRSVEMLLGSIKLMSMYTSPLTATRTVKVKIDGIREKAMVLSMEFERSRQEITGKLKQIRSDGNLFFQKQLQEESS